MKILTHEFTGTQRTTAFLNSLLKQGLFILLISFFCAPAFSQILSPQAKIDPAFRHLTAQARKSDASSLNNIPSALKIEPVKRIDPKTGIIEERYECIVYTTNVQALRNAGIVVNSTLPSFVTAWVTPEQIDLMAGLIDVKYIQAPAIDYLHNDISVGNTGASLLHQGKLNNTSYRGKNVIVAIYDTGIDWKHFDFRDPNDTTKSRILRIWDQTLTAVAGEAAPSPFSYGVEYTQTQINDEIDGTPTNVVRERDINGHGSHVAGTAAGNGAALPGRKYTGMAPEADLVIIKGGEGSFTESREIDGITYLKNLATTLGKPVVLNMSLGGQTGAHDGTRPSEVAVDDFTSSAPGRAIVISAGNDNGTNIHNRMNLAPGGSSTVSFNVPAGTSGTDVFQFSTWANGTPNISATMNAPAGGSVTVNINESKGVLVQTDSFQINLTNALYSTNGQRYINAYITRNGANTASPAGVWNLTITNNGATAIVMDGWLNYTNTAFSGTTVVNGNSDYLVGSPGTATSAITVASFAARNNWYSYAASGAFTFPNTRVDSISSFSSRGPRRDGVLKPEIAANGEAVISCLSSSTTSFASSSITNVGLYAKDQGTSMAAPGTAGAVALLLQANPGVTISQIKSLLAGSATKDAMTEITGATPNALWGYGKLDIYKAASSLFNCIPADRKTYKYDSSTRNAQEVGTTFSTTRVGVRFTPDISGKLGGVFFHTSTTATGLFVEVRSNNGGTPGGLLGTVNLDSAFVTRYSWQYVDLSNLSIPVTSGTDYFVIIGRGNGSTNWSLRGEALSVDGRSYQSTDAGVTWTPITTQDFKIRSIVYNSSQGTIAAGNSTDTRNINTSNQFINSNCGLIAQLQPSGVNAITGNVTAKVWLETGVPTFGSTPYVSRHYEITPATSAATATGKVTLYFTQAEFNAFNANAGSILDLPANPTDNAGKANLRVGKFPGTSSDNTGLPGTYTGTPQVIDPADGDIVWNAEYNRWEISFDVTGFSGFVLQTSQFPLPIFVEYFKGNKQGNANILSWKISCTGSTPAFEVERSDNGYDFTVIGTIPANSSACNQPVNFKDALPLTGNNYYRIKVTDNSSVRYTSIILLQNDKLLITALYPTVIRRGESVQINYSGTKGTLIIHDVAGRKLYTQPLTNGVQSLNLPVYASGVYFYNIKNDNRLVMSGKIIVQ